MANPTPDLVDLLLRQGAQWLADLAQIERWLDQREADELAALQACPLPDLPAHVERLRAARWEAVTRAALRPETRRTPPPDAVTHEHQRRPRGLARHLYAKGKP